MQLVSNIGIVMLIPSAVLLSLLLICGKVLQASNWHVRFPPYSYVTEVLTSNLFPTLLLSQVNSRK